MSGWLAMPAEAWPAIAEALPQPWPESAAAMDLRWHVDRRGSSMRDPEPSAADLVRGIPGRPSLAKRWGWTDHRVRTLLAAVERWWDEGRWGPPLRSSPADRQPVASPPPADRQPEDGPTLVPEEESPADRQPVASPPPADRHRRVGSPAPAPSPALEQLLALQSETGVEPNDADRCALAAELVAGRTQEQLEAIWAEGMRPERAIRARRWAVLLAGQFAELRRTALRKHSERRALQGDYGPEPPPSPSPPPPLAAPEARGWWSASEPAPAPPAAAPAPEPPRPPPRPRGVGPVVERPSERPPPDEEQQRRNALALERVRQARARAPPGADDGT